MANLKIKVWNIIWLPDDVIIRPPAMKKTRGKKKAVDLEGGEVENIVENEEAEDGEKIGTLQAFHGVGTRGLFYFYAEHCYGLGVRLSGCHCPFCIRCYRKSMGSNKCIYDFFDVAKVLLVQDSTFTVNVFSRQPNAPTFHNSAT